MLEMGQLGLIAGKSEATRVDGWRCKGLHSPNLQRYCARCASLTLQLLKVIEFD